MTVKEAALKLGWTEDRVYAYIRRGLIPVEKVKKTVSYSSKMKAIRTIEVVDVLELPEAAPVGYHGHKPGCRCRAHRNLPLPGVERHKLHCTCQKCMSEGRTKSVSFKVDAETHEGMTQAARKMNVNVSEFVRIAVTALLVEVE